MALEMTGMIKQFGDVTALGGVDFAVKPGEVHALLGENGAGKTTLMNIACGILKADAGDIRVRGEAVDIRSPHDGYRHGLGIVHQNYRLIRNFTVAENLHVGWRESPRLASTGAMRTRTKELAERYGLKIDPDKRIFELSAGEAQRVAILRTLAHGASTTLVLDEPTAVLTPQESQGLFRIVRSMVEDGHSVVFVSHKLHEVMDIGDRVTVLRRGLKVFSGNKAQCTVDSLARDMIGREVIAAVRRPSKTARRPAMANRNQARGSVRSPPPAAVQRWAAIGEPLLDLKGVFGITLRNVNLQVYKGEIVGIAGVAGNGQPELAAVATGLMPSFAGKVIVRGTDLTKKSPEEFIKAGVGHIPEEMAVGMAMRESVETNAVMKSLDEPALNAWVGLSLGRLRQFAVDLLNAAGLTGINPKRRVNTLSGGQMQRLLVQRELVAGGRVLVAVHPSRGLDVGATERVHATLIDAVEKGAAVLLISEDLDEVLKLSDRIAVLYEGGIQGRFARGQADRKTLGLLMGGAHVRDAQPAR